MPKTWRNRAAPVIAKLLAENAGRTEKEIRSALRKAYPFERRQGWAYVVWLDEIKRQRRKRTMKARAPFGKPLEGQLRLGLEE